MNDLERALYPHEAEWPLGIDVHGDEHENPAQPRRPAFGSADPAVSARVRREFMRNSWGLTDAEIDRLESL